MQGEEVYEHFDTKKLVEDPPAGKDIILVVDGKRIEIWNKKRKIIAELGKILEHYPVGDKRMMPEEEKKEIKKRKTTHEEKMEHKGEIEVEEKRKKKAKFGDDEEKEKKGKSEVSDKDFVIKCRPSGLSALVRELNHNQKSAVESIGFGGLLHLKDLYYVPWSHMYWFLENFNATSRVLDVEGNKKIVVTADDISDLFLLPRHEGSDVLLTKDNEEVKAFIEGFKEKYGLKGAVQLSVVQKLLKELRDGCNDFKRCFVLYCLSSFLAPTANQSIDLSVMRSLIDTEKITSFDWYKYVLEKLCKAMLAFQNKPRKKTLNGCVLVLPLLYFHHLTWQGRAEPSTLPLIRHWTSKKIKERVYAECLAGRFGQGEWVDDVYPRSRRDRESETQRENKVSVDKVFEEIVEVESKGLGRCITFQLPPDEKDDMEIQNMAKDVLDESFLLLKRDLNVIYHVHMERMRKIKKSLQRQETQPSSSDVVPDI